VAFGDFEGLHPCPQRRQPVLQVEDVGDQSRRRGRRAPSGGREHRGGELGDRRGAFTAEADRAFASGQLGLHAVDGAGVVLTGEVCDQTQQCGAGFQLGSPQHVDLVEERILGQGLCRCGKGFSNFSGLPTC